MRDPPPGPPGAGAPVRLKLVGSGGLSLTLEAAGERVLGRVGGDLLVDDPSVSARHCRIFRRAGGVYVEDLGSTNGTFLDDEPVRAATRWDAGRILRVGTHQLHLEVEGTPLLPADLDDGDDGDHTQVLESGAVGLRHQLELLRLEIQVEELRRSVVESGGRMIALTQGLAAADSDRARLRVAARRLEMAHAVERLLTAEQDPALLPERLLATLIDGQSVDLTSPGAGRGELEPRGAVFLDDAHGRLVVAAVQGGVSAEDHLPAVAAALGRAHGTGARLDPGSIVVPLRSPRGAIGAVLLYPRDGLDDGWLDTLHDLGEQVALTMTHLRSVEAVKVARDQALAASRTKSRFLETMSHELRTPLNAILGYAQMLLEDAHDEGRQDLIGDLERIDRSARHLLAMIAGILDLTAIEAGGRELHFATFDAADLVRDVVDSVRLDAERQQNRIVLDLPTPVPLDSDHELVHRLIYNLLSNANKFTDHGEIRVSASSRGRAVHLQVRDTGIGIPADRIGAIFDPFTQVDDSRTRVYGGTGIGLAVVKQFTETLGGRVSVASVPGRGSIFTVTLPAGRNG